MTAAAGNTSYWIVSFGIANHGAAASPAVAILLDGAPVAFDQPFVGSGATTQVHANVTDPSVAVDALCLAHHVTVAIWGYIR